MKKLDRMMTPAGLIAGAKMYSLIIKDGMFHAVFVGAGFNANFVRSGGSGKHGGVVAHVLTNKMVQNKEKKYKEVESEMDREGIEKVSTRKGSFSCPIQEVEVIKVTEVRNAPNVVYVAPELHVRIKGKKKKFQSLTHSQEEIETFIVDLKK